MKTESIKNLYREEDIPYIDTIRINRLDSNGAILNVDFQDILLFPNLKNLYIENISKDLENLNGKNLVLDNVDIKLELLSNLVFNELILREFTLDKEYVLNAKYLDIQKCDIKNYNIFSHSEIETITISKSQYLLNNQFFDTLKKKIIIMEDNGQFIYKKVGF